MKRKRIINKLEPELTETFKLIRMKVSYSTNSSIHVIFIQLCDVATSEKLPDNQPERKKVSYNTVSST